MKLLARLNNPGRVRPLLAGLLLAAAGAGAATPITECPKHYEPAAIQVEALVSTNLGACPLLQQKRLRKLVDKYAFGTLFAYPTAPGSCISGAITSGSVTTAEGSTNVTGTTESAQRIFAEASAVHAPLGGLFLPGASMSGTQFISGAAMTAVSLEGAGDSKFKLELLLDDRFTIKLDGFPFVNTEDFNIVGSEGRPAVGRLLGIASIAGDPTAPLVDVPFSVTGTICLK